MRSICSLALGRIASPAPFAVRYRCAAGPRGEWTATARSLACSSCLPAVRQTASVAVCYTKVSPAPARLCDRRVRPARPGLGPLQCGVAHGYTLNAGMLCWRLTTRRPRSAAWHPDLTPGYSL